jgi:hypothetical protein
MEKLIYAVWRRPETSVAEFKRAMLGETAEGLIGLGAQRLSMGLVDEHVDYALGSRITRMDEPLSGMVSLWLHTALERAPLEQRIGAAVGRCAGYLVVESMPIVNTTRVAPIGERRPGVNTVAFLKKPDWLSYDEWRERWQGQHTRVAIETQSTFLYVQNVVVRPVTEGAPPWTAIVEEGFPSAALTDPKVFYDAGDSDEKLKRNMRRMIESCKRFIDFDQLESHVMSEYVLKDQVPVNPGSAE